MRDWRNRVFSQRSKNKPWLVVCLNFPLTLINLSPSPISALFSGILTPHLLDYFAGCLLSEPGLLLCALLCESLLTQRICCSWINGEKGRRIGFHWILEFFKFQIRFSSVNMLSLLYILLHNYCCVNICKLLIFPHLSCEWFHHPSKLYAFLVFFGKFLICSQHQVTLFENNGKFALFPSSL